MKVLNICEQFVPQQGISLPRFLKAFKQKSRENEVKILLQQGSPNDSALSSVVSPLGRIDLFVFTNPNWGQEAVNALAS